MIGCETLNLIIFYCEVLKQNGYYGFLGGIKYLKVEKKELL